MPEHVQWPSLAQSLLKKEHIFAVALTTSGKLSLRRPKSFVKGIYKCIHFPAGLIRRKSKPCSTMAGVHFNRGWFKSFFLCENHEWSRNAVGENPIVSWWLWTLTETENCRNLVVFAEHYNPLQMENSIPNICTTEIIDKITAK